MKNPSLWGSVRRHGNWIASPQCKIFNMNDPSLWGTFWILFNQNSSPQCRISWSKFLPHNVGFILWKILHCGELSECHGNRHTSPQCKIYHLKEPSLWGSFWIFLNHNSSPQCRRSLGKFLPHNVGFIPWKILQCGEVSDYHSNRHASPQCKRSSL